MPPQHLSAAMRPTNQQQQQLMSRHMRPHDPHRRALPMHITPSSLQLDASLTNPLASDLLVDPNAMDGVLAPASNPRNDPGDVARAAAAAAEAA
ncbi:unnamed protein product, partial [Agarophyton chilense]